MVHALINEFFLLTPLVLRLLKLKALHFNRQYVSISHYHSRELGADALSSSGPACHLGCSLVRLSKPYIQAEQARLGGLQKPRLVHLRIVDVLNLGQLFRLLTWSTYRFDSSVMRSLWLLLIRTSRPNPGWRVL